MNNNIHDETNSSFVSNSEKKQLKERVFRTIEQLKRRKRIRYTLTTAASVALLLGLGYKYTTYRSESDITNFVVNTESINNSSDKTTIIIDGKEISVEGEETSIVYSKTGGQVDLGKAKTITQKTHDNKSVKYNTLAVPYGKRSTIKLSDGTTAWLNAGSKLIYPAIFDSDVREVYLIGEASFDVAHDKQHPFRVLTGNQEIEVLGTVFNVSSYPDDSNHFVVLKSGSVKLFHKSKETKGLFGNNKAGSVITPGTKANLNLKTNKVTEEQVDVDVYFAWMKGVLIVKNDGLEGIMKRLSRYYNVKISINNASLKNETFSGYLDLKDNIENVLKILKESTALDDFKITKTNEITIN